MYNKLFTKILDSTVWLESNPTRIVWITFLACMDEDGFVALSSIGNVAARARVTIEEAEAAVMAFESPDSVDPEQEFEGRRVERVPSGWMVLNSKKYRDIIKRETQKEETRIRVAKHRAKKAGNAVVTDSNEKVTLSVSNAVTNAKTLHPPSSDASPVPSSPLGPVLEKRPSLETVVTPTGAVDKSAPRGTSAARGTRFDPKGGFPEEWRAWCVENRPDLKPQETFDSFSDFWVARPGQAAVKLDWFATWRNWCRKEGKQAGGAARAQPGSAPRPEIRCRSCGRLVKTWTDGKCDECWRGARNSPTSADPHATV